MSFARHLERQAESGFALARQVKTRQDWHDDVQRARSAMLAATAAPEAPPEPAAPEPDSVTTEERETRQEASADGATGAKEERVTKTTDTRSPVATEAGEGSADGEERTWLEEKRARGEARAESIRDWYVRLPAQMAGEVVENVEQFVSSGMRDLWGLRDDLGEDTPEVSVAGQAIRDARKAVAFSDPDSRALNATMEIGAVLAPWVGWYKAAGLAIKGAGTGASVAKSLAAEGATALVNMDPHGDRISTWLAQVPWLRSRALEYLGSNPEDQPAYEGMLKNLVEAGTVGTLAEGVVLGLKMAAPAAKAGQLAPPTPTTQVERATARQEAVEEYIEAKGHVQERMAARFAEDAVADVAPGAKAAEPQAAPAEGDELDDFVPPEDVVVGGGAVDDVVAGADDVDDVVGGLEGPDREDAAAEWLEAYYKEMDAGAIEPEALPRSPQGEAGEEAAEEIESIALLGGGEDELTVAPPASPMERQRIAREARIEAALAEEERLPIDLYKPESIRPATPEAERAAVETQIERKVVGLDPVAQRRERTALRLTHEMARSIVDTPPAEVVVKRAENGSAADAQLLREHKDVQRALRNLAALRDVPLEKGPRGKRFRDWGASRKALAYRMVDLQGAVRRALVGRQAPGVSSPRGEVMEGLARAETGETKAAETAAAERAALPEPSTTPPAEMAPEERIADVALRSRRGESNAAIAKHHDLSPKRVRAILARARRQGDTTAAPRLRTPEERAAASAARRATVRALWRNQPVEGRVGVSIETSSEAVLISPMDRPRAKATFADVVERERDAKAIAPLTVEPRHAVGAADRIETPDRIPGTTIAPDAVATRDDFASLAEEMAVLPRGGALPDEAAHRGAQSSLEGLLSDGGLPMTLRPEAQARAVEHLELVAAMANDVRRTAGRAVVGQGSLEDLWDSELAQERLGAYLRWLGGDDAGADKVLGYLPDAPAWRAASPEDRIRMQSRAAERAGVANLLGRAAGVRDQTSLEGMVRTVLRTTDTAPQMGLLRRFNQGSLHAWVSGVLSGPPTQVLNAVGNLAMTAVRFGEVPLSRGIETLMSGQGGREAWLAAETAMHAQAAGLLQGLRDLGAMTKYSAARQGWGTAATRARHLEEYDGTLRGAMLDQFDEHEKLDLDPYRTLEMAQHGQMLSAGKAGIPVELVHAVEDMDAFFGKTLREMSFGLSSVVQSPLAVLKMSDGVFKTAAMRTALREQATRRALRDVAPGTARRADVVAERIRDIESRSWSGGDRDHDVWQAAAQEAEAVTFTSKMPEPMERLLKGMNERAGGTARQLFPFVRVISNLSLEAASRLPGVGFARWASPAYRRQMRLLSETDRARIVSGQAAKTLTGGLVLTLGGMMYRDGSLTDGGYGRRQFGAANRELNPVYGLRLGNGWMGQSQDLFATPGMLLAMGADIAAFHEAATTEHDFDRGQELLRIGLNLSGVLLNAAPTGNALDYAETLGELIHAHEKGRLPDAAARTAIRGLGGRAAQMLPLSTFRRKLAEAITEPGARRRAQAMGVDLETQTELGLIESIWSQAVRSARRDIPGLDDTLPPVRSWDGSVLHLAPAQDWARTAPGLAGMVRGFNAMLSPRAYLPDSTRDPVQKAMLRYEASPDWAPRSISESLGGATFRVPLTPEESDWVAQRQGTLARRGAERLLSSALWKSDRRTAQDRHDALQSVFDGAAARALRELPGQFPDIETRLEHAYAAERARQRAQSAQREAA